MEARTIGFGVAAAVCGLFGSIVMYSMERDHRESERAKARDRLKELQAELATAEERKTRATTRLDAAKAQVAASSQSAKSLEDQLAATKTELEATKNSLEEVRSRVSESVRQKAIALERNRAAAVGTTYASLPLTNGKVLVNAKLSKLTPQELSFSHSLGRSTVPWSLLPQEIIERFELGTHAEGEVIVDPIADEDVLVPEEPASAGPSPEEIATRAARLDEARLRLAKMDNAIRTAQTKAAPNPQEIQRLLDLKAALELRIRRMEAARFE